MVGPSSAKAAAKAMCSIATAGVMTRSYDPLTASTAPALVRGRSTSRTGSSPGNPSKPIIPRSGRTAPSMNPAAARAARLSPGTPIRRPGSDSRMHVACSSRCTAKPRSGSEIRFWLGPTFRATPSAAAATKRPAARAGSCGCRGKRRPKLPAPPTSTRSRPMDPTGARVSRRFPPCQWCRTPPETGSSSSSAAS